MQAWKVSMCLCEHDNPVNKAEENLMNVDACGSFFLHGWKDQGRWETCVKTIFLSLYMLVKKVISENRNKK